jgi:short-subunit dehydrogenase
LKNENIQTKWIELDAVKQEMINNEVQQVLNDYGQLGVLINNAAVYLESESPSQTLMNKMREIFETNFFGVFAVTRVFLPVLEKSDKARIVNVFQVEWLPLKSHY